MADGTVGVKQAAGADRQIDNDTDGSKYRQKVWDAGPVGTWGYLAGVSGTETVTGRVVSIAARGTGATLTINGGDTVAIPDGGFEFSPSGALVDPVLVFTDTDSYFVEVVT